MNFDEWDEEENQYSPFLNLDDVEDFYERKEEIENDYIDDSLLEEQEE